MRRAGGTHTHAELFGGLSSAPPALRTDLAWVKVAISRKSLSLLVTDSIVECTTKFNTELNLIASSHTLEWIENEVSLLRTFEATLRVRVALAIILALQWIGTQLAFKSDTIRLGVVDVFRSDDVLGRRLVLDPIHQRENHVVLSVKSRRCEGAVETLTGPAKIEGCLSSSAVSHTRY